MHAGDHLGLYLLRREIGDGGIAAVFIAEHTPRKVDVTLKVLRSEFVAQPQTLALFLGEPRALRAVEHENTLEVTDVVADAPNPYFATELLRGTTLAELLRRGPLGLPRAVHIARQVAAVLAHAHDVEVVHRNLKPVSVFLVTKDGTPDFVKLLELGATRMQSQGEKPVPGTVIGTPAYMAPEQLRQTPGDHRVDMYSFGVMLFELAAGRRPFVGEVAAVVRQQLLERAPRARSLAPTVPAVLDDLIALCLEKDPGARPPSMHEVSLALAALAETLGAPPLVDEGPGPSIAVPKNTSGYTAVAADATVAPPAMVVFEDDEPSFESVTGERAVVREVEQAAPSAPVWTLPAQPLPEIERTRDLLRPAPRSWRLPAIVAGAMVAALLVVRWMSAGEGAVIAPVKPDAMPSDAGVARAPDVLPVPPTPVDGPKASGAPELPVEPLRALRDSHAVGFTSTPAGAQVWIRMDKRIRLLCSTPCSFTLPAGKRVLVELRLDGFESAERTITVAEGVQVNGTLRAR